MTTTLKKRVETLEEQVRKLAEAVQPESLRKDWRDTFATSADDEGFDEMDSILWKLRQARPGLTVDEDNIT